MKNLNHLLPQELKNQVHIAWDSIAANVDRSTLTSEELEKYQAFKNPERKREYLIARKIIHQLTSQMGLEAEHFVVTKDADGKPVGDYSGNAYHMSIAHSSEKVICAISSEFAIGIDIEPMGRQINVDLRSRVMNNDEVDTLQGINTLRIWTIKEALVKLHGKKLSSRLKDCVITGWDSDIYSADIDGDMEARVYSHNYENHWLAVAWEGKN